jgi:hypothetical protein
MITNNIQHNTTLHNITPHNTIEYNKTQHTTHVNYYFNAVKVWLHFKAHILEKPIHLQLFLQTPTLTLEEFKNKLTPIRKWFPKSARPSHNRKYNFTN